MEEDFTYAVAEKGRDWEVEAEVDFLTACLRDAYIYLDTVSKNGAVRGKKYLERDVSSWLWINGRHSKTILPFERVCEALNYDAGRVRNSLRKIVERYGKTDFFDGLSRKYFS